MNSNIRQVYLPQRLQPSGAAANVGRFLWHVVQLSLAIATYALYCLNDHVSRVQVGYQHVIHIPVSYESQG